MTTWSIVGRVVRMLGSVGLPAEAEPDDPPLELSENLPDSVYALCSVSGRRPHISYASPGFKALFQVTALQELSGCERLLGDQAAIEALSCRTRLSSSDLTVGLRWLEARMAAVGSKVAAGPRFVQHDIAWVVRITRAGQPIVCEVTFVLHRSEELGQDILAAVHKDVSRQVSLRKLLRAAASGAGPLFTTSLKEQAIESLYFRGPLLDSAPDAAKPEDADTAKSEGAVPEKTRPQALEDALLACGCGPVSFQLTKGGIVGLKVPGGDASAPPSKSAGEEGVGNAVHTAVAKAVLNAEYFPADAFPFTASTCGFEDTGKGEFLACTMMPTKWDQACGRQQTASVDSAHLILRKAATGSWGAILWA